MLVNYLPVLFKIISYSVLLILCLFSYLYDLSYVSIGLLLLCFAFLWLDYSDWRLKRFFSYDFLFSGKGSLNLSQKEMLNDIDMVLANGSQLRALLLMLEKEGLNKLDFKSTIKKKANLVLLYKEIESLLNALNTHFWKYNLKTDLKTEKGKQMYFVYIASFIYLYEAGARLSSSSLFTVTLLSEKSETFKNLMRSLVFPSTQILIESGGYVLSKLKFSNDSVELKKKVFVNEYKNYMDINNFPFLSSVKYYLSVLKLFKNQKLLPYFKSFLIRISNTKLREGSMAMKLDDVSKVLEVLEPGDIVLVRRATTMTSVVIPGYWTHAALYVGSFDQIEDYFGVDAKNVTDEFERLNLDKSESYVFEAVEKGVSASGHLKGLLADSIVVLKPKVGAFDRLKAVEFVLEHIEKDYDYGLDFFSEGSFVCSELVYKAYMDDESGVHKLGFKAGFKGGLVYTFSPQDMYEASMDNLDDKFEVGICLKHDKKYTKVEKVNL